jgi:hypothetical protein
MTKISKKAQAAETTTEVVNTPAEVQTTPIEAPKEEILEEPISDVEFEEAPKEQGAPFEENVPAPEAKEEAPEPEPEFEPELEQYQDDFELEDVLDDEDDISGDAFELLDALEAESLPSLDEIKAKERSLRKR